MNSMFGAAGGGLVKQLDANGGELADPSQSMPMSMITAPLPMATRSSLLERYERTPSWFLVQNGAFQSMIATASSLLTAIMGHHPGSNSSELT